MIVTLNHIIKHLYKCSSSFIPHLDSYVNSDEYSEKIFEKSTLFCKFDDDKLIGLLAVYDNPTEKFGWITNVSVDPDYFGKGIATELLKECHKHFEIKKYFSIFLEVFLDNKKALNHINYKGEGSCVNGEHLVCSGNLLVLNKLECHCVTSCRWIWSVWIEPNCS